MDESFRYRTFVTSRLHTCQCTLPFFCKNRRQRTLPIISDWSAPHRENHTMRSQTCIHDVHSWNAAFRVFFWQSMNRRQRRRTGKLRWSWRQRYCLWSWWRSVRLCTVYIVDVILGLWRLQWLFKCVPLTKVSVQLKVFCHKNRGILFTIISNMSTTFLTCIQAKTI